MGRWAGANVQGTVMVTGLRNDQGGSVTDHQRRHLALPDGFAATLRQMHTMRDHRLTAVLHAAVVLAGQGSH